MRVQYGSYIHGIGEGAVKIRKQQVYTPRTTLREVEETWDIRGTLTGTSQADLTNKIAALREAYSTNDQTLVLLQDNGAASDHILDIASTASGIQVMDLSFPEGQNAEYATGRTYEITVRGRITQTEDFGLISFQETISFQGNGGPRIVGLETLSGPPVIQQVAASTLCRAIQSGTAVGYGSYPSVPDPIWPSAEDQSQRSITPKGPAYDGYLFTDFQIDWQYIFVSTSPLSGLPNAL